MKIELDEGYMFGMGAFETIAVENRRPVFLKEHLRRLAEAMDFLEIDRQVREEEVREYLRQHPIHRGALKIMASAENLVYTARPNPYGEEQYRKGFLAGFGNARRNETSGFTYHKTFQYGDCLMEKRKAKRQGLDEVIFLNTKGQICEGAVSNIFFVKDKRIYAPEIACGLLPGIIRDYVYKTENVTDCILYTKDLNKFDECFLTNSLMGIMPVVKLGGQVFEKRQTAMRLLAGYRQIQE